MPEVAKLVTLSVDQALRCAIIHAWDDFSSVAPPRAIRVEYLSEPGAPLNQLTVWLVSHGGYQNRMCDYRAGSSLDLPRIWQCWMRLRSAKLVGGLNFIMKNQQPLLRHSAAGPNGLVVVRPPTEEQRIEAAAWVAGIGLGALPAADLRACAALSHHAR